MFRFEGDAVPFAPFALVSVAEVEPRLVHRDLQELGIVGKGVFGVDHL